MLPLHHQLQELKNRHLNKSQQFTDFRINRQSTWPVFSKTIKCYRCHNRQLNHETMVKRLRLCIKFQSKSSLWLKMSWRHISLPRKSSLQMSVVQMNYTDCAMRSKLRVCVKCSWDVSNLKCSTTSSKPPSIPSVHIRLTSNKVWTALMKILARQTWLWSPYLSLPRRKTVVAVLKQVRMVSLPMYLALQMTQTIVRIQRQTHRPNKFCNKRLLHQNNYIISRWKHKQIALKIWLQLLKSAVRWHLLPW